jgi:N-acyl-D-amino-acid deacylase
MFDLVIRAGTVIDGSNTPRRRADVAVQGDRIVEVGVQVGRGREEIDARGRIVAPGFIDAHTHDDLVILAEPQMRPKISQGVKLLSRSQ